MSLNFTITVEKDNATSTLGFLDANLTPHRLAQEVGPRATTLVRDNFWNRGKNKKGWPSTHFWLRAAESTTWQEESGSVSINVSQVGVRQRLLGGDIRPVTAGALTIPARADAYGKRARDFNNLKFGMVFDPESGKMCPALVEAQSAATRAGRSPKGTPATTLNKSEAVFWLSKGVRQEGDPSVLPTDEAFAQVIEQSMQAILNHPETN